MRNKLCIGCAALLAWVVPGISPAQPRVELLEPGYTVDCGDNQIVELAGKIVETDGDGVQIHGNCTVEITDSQIVAGGTAVRAAGNGVVQIEHSHVEGAIVALRASGNAQIIFSNTVVVGGVESGGNAVVVDGGGNELIAGGAPTSSVSARSSGDIQIDDSNVRLPGVVVEDRGRQVVIGGAGVFVDGDFVRIGAGSASVEVADDWRTAVPSRYDTGGVLVELGADRVGDGWRLNLAGDVLFEFGSAEIRPDSVEPLRKVAQVLRDRASRDIVVIGHTDSVGGDADNQSLSERRALAVMHWLNVHESIPVALMKGRGMGETEPIAYNTLPDGSDNPAGRAQNRRVEIRFAAR